MVKFQGITVNGITFSDFRVILMDDLSEELIIGSYFMQINDIILMLQKEKIIFSQTQNLLAIPK